MYDLTQLTLQNVTEIGSALRALGKQADSLETLAAGCVDYFHKNLIDAHTGSSACVLARFFKTHPYGALPETLQAQARKSMGAAPRDNPAGDLKCLTLLSTVGDEGQWCDRTASRGHQAIPLTSESAVSQIPMISQLIKSFGLDISYVLSPDPDLIMELERKTCNVFYIPNALGSKFIPAQQEFVEPYGVKSVLGFGGILPAGDLFAIILFTRVRVPEATAHLFKTLPLNIKMAMLPLDKGSPFSVPQKPPEVFATA